MGLFDAFGRLLRPSGVAEKTTVLCPRCEKLLDDSHDTKACESQGLTRRFFFGLLGATSAALALRIEGVPLPTARHMVIARSGDYIQVKPIKGCFAIAWDRPRNDKSIERYDDEFGLIPASDVQKFMPDDAEKIYVDRNLPEMRIVSVIDETTHQPLEFRVIRGEDIWKKREAERNCRTRCVVIRRQEGR